MNDIEERLRETFNRFESHAPTAVGLTEAVKHQAHGQRQRRRVSIVAGTVIAVGALTTTALLFADNGSPEIQPISTADGPCSALFDSDYGVTKVLATLTTLERLSESAGDGVTINLEPGGSLCVVHATNLAPPIPDGNAPADTLMATLTVDGTISVVSMGPEAAVMKEYNQFADPPANLRPRYELSPPSDPTPEVEGQAAIDELAANDSEFNPDTAQAVLTDITWRAFNLDDRTVWVVTAPDYCEPLFGGLDSNGDVPEGRPSCSNVIFNALIDADTGERLLEFSGATAVFDDRDIVDGAYAPSSNTTG